METKGNLEQTYGKYEKELAFMPIGQFRKLAESTKKMAVNYGKTKHEKRRLIAEVIEHRGSCAANYKKGDKLVFDVLGMFLPDESSGRVACSWLFAMLIPAFASNEGLMSHNVEFREPYFDRQECSDPGPPTGWGHIKVKLYME